MKLQGFELEIEGSREDAALISKQVTNQITGMLDIEGIIEGKAKRTTPNPPLQADESTAPAKPRKKRASGPKYTKEEKAEIAAIAFFHNPENFGNPQQGWTTVQKALWLLYVLKETNLGDSHPGVRLTNTFNEHFKQSGKIATGNVNRDLGKAKSQAPALVGEDKVGKFGNWFLTDTGRQEAQKLVAEARGGGESL